MKKQLLVGMFFLACSQLNAQTEQLGQPVSWKAKVTLSKKTVNMPAVDNVAEQTAEMNRRLVSSEKNLRFGVELPVSIDFMQQADVKTLPNGDVLRQLTIKSPGAISLNLIFSQFELAKGSRLYLFDKNLSEFIGAHTSLNNNPHKVLGTELIHGEAIVIELTEPAAVAGTSTLVVGTVVHGFLDLEQELKSLNSSGSCEYDVNCPIGSGWENQRNSVAMVLNGGGLCTGSLVNNTSGVIIPYFLSANHCGSNPTSWVFRFRWESPAAQADCGTSAPSVDGPTTMTVNGSTLRANGVPSDFILVELNANPNPAWGVYYNGWDRTENSSPSAASIHHPSSDIKKISIENTPLISTTFGSCPPNSHWGVTGWDQGVTENGSSGGPLFDVNHRTIGQLHGGASTCNGSNLSDQYGKFSVSWTGGGTDATRLSNWLDPGNTDAASVNGVDPAGPGIVYDASVGNLGNVTGTYCASSVTPTVKISNAGTAALTSATITYGFDGNVTQIYNWVGNLNQYQSEVITLPMSIINAGTHTFEAVVSNPNGNTDENNGNNTTAATFTIVANGTFADLTLTLDCFGDEISWQVREVTANTLLYQGGPYAEDNGGTVITQSFCLAKPGCYKFVLNDSYGDGMTGGTCTIEGSYTLMNNNVQVAGLTTAQAGFGAQNVQQFCLQVAGLPDFNELQKLWSIYPNPADNFLNINMTALEGAKTILVKNTTGQIVRKIESANKQESIEVTSLAKGVYFVSLETAAGTTTKTFIVK